MFDYDDPIITKRRLGDSFNDPYIAIKDVLTLDQNGKAILTEIPDSFSKVVVTSSDNKQWFEIQYGVLTENTFIVDYKNKIVTFNVLNAGKQLSFTYMGTGLTYVPTSMIYTQANNGNVTETLKQLTDETKVARDTANTSALSANEKATLADQKATLAQVKADFAQSVADSIKTNWLPAVPKYTDLASTYPSPLQGDTVQTIDDSKIYRYENSIWKFTQQYTASALTDVQNKIGNPINSKTDNQVNLMSISNEIHLKEMFPNQSAIRLEGMTIGDFVLTRTKVILGNITLA